MTTTNSIVTIGICIMVLGLIVHFGIFDRLGPVRTQKGMQRLAMAMFAIGFFTILSQSTPN